tara:strand:- start:400 stop:1125 length:726 start_codon:yes stop_codon:yes gene_type:complete
MLPRIDTPTYNLTIPSSGNKIKYRPFLVKEEKILLMAQEGEALDDKIDAVKQIIRNCVLQDIDVEKLSTFDIEYIFVNLRSKSVGNVVELNYKREGCEKKEEGKISECNIPFILNLDEVKITKDRSIDPTIKLTDTISIKMKYPDFRVLDKVMKSESYDDLIEVITSCVEQIEQGDELYVASDHPIEELMEFVESMSQQQFEKINEFFQTIPETICEVSIKCRKCGFTKDIDVRGISDFFF